MHEVKILIVAMNCKTLCFWSLWQVFSQQWIMGARCTISLNELVHSCIILTREGAFSPLQSLLSGPVPIIHECTSSFSDIVHLAPIIHCCGRVKVPTYMLVHIKSFFHCKHVSSNTIHVNAAKIDREKQMTANVFTLIYFSWCDSFCFIQQLY